LSNACPLADCGAGKARPSHFDCGCDARAVTELLTDVPEEPGTWHYRLALLAFAARLRPIGSVLVIREP